MNLKREYYLNSVINNLRWLCDYVELQKKEGLYDILAYSEAFFCQLFNHVYGWELKSLDHNDFPDLVDVINSLAIEITSNDSMDRIRSIIRHGIKNEVYLRYTKLIIFILTAKKRDYNTILKRIRNADDIFLMLEMRNVDDLIQDIYELPLEDLQIVYHYIENSFIIQNFKKKADVAAPQVLTDYEPIVAALIGREKEVSEIEKLIQTEKVIAITGDAGIGKTTIASYIYNKLKLSVDHIGWIRSDGNLEKDFLQLNIQNGVQSNSLRFSSIIDWINERNKAVYVFIDEWDIPLTEDDVLFLFNAANKLRIIFISRSKDLFLNTSVIVKEIEPLDYENSYKLFYNNYSMVFDTERDAQIRNMLNTVGGNPALIVMLGHAYSNYTDHNSTKDFLIQEDIINSIVGRNNTVFLSEFSDEERRILRLFSILPTDREIWYLFLEWANFDKSAMDHLLKLGVIQYKEPNYLIHDYIKKILLFEFETQQSQEIDFNQYGEFILGLCDTESYLSDNQNDSTIDLRICVPKAICNYIIKHNIISDNVASLIIGIAKILVLQNNLDEAMEYYAYYLRQCERIFGKHHFNTVKGYIGIAKVYCASSEYDEALIYIDRIQKLIRDLSIDDYQKSELYYDIGCIYNGIKDFENGINRLKESIHLLLNENEKEHSLMRKAYFAIADAFAQRKEYDQAIFYYKKSNKICEHAASYNAIALCYHEIAEYHKAFVNYKKALKMMYGKYSASHNASFIIRNNLCCLIDTVDKPYFVHFENDKLELFDFSKYNLVGARFNSSLLKDCKLIETNLHYASFEKSRIVDGDFSAADFTAAVFKDSYLESVNFATTDFREAIFMGGVIRNCCFRNVDLSDAIFINCKMKDVDFTGANLEGTDLSTAELNNVCLANCCLRGTKLTAEDNCEPNAIS